MNVSECTSDKHVANAICKQYFLLRIFLLFNNLGICKYHIFRERRRAYFSILGCVYEEDVRLSRRNTEFIIFIVKLRILIHRNIGGIYQL